MPPRAIVLFQKKKKTYLIGSGMMGAPPFGLVAPAGELAIGGAIASLEI